MSPEPRPVASPEPSPVASPAAGAPFALVTNDDGIGAEGLRVLAAAARDAGFDVLVAAPHEERSGASASLTVLEDDGLVARDAALDGLDVRAVAVEASPALIAFVAMHGAFGRRPDVVLSGVNHGPNTGQAVLHSGTVGAAMTGVAHGAAGAAFSLATIGTQHGLPDDPARWTTVRSVLDGVLPWLRDAMASGGPGDAVVNVNVPDVPPGALRGLVEAPLAPFGAVQADVGERDGDRLTVTFSALDVERGTGSDAALLLDGWATVTAVRAPCRSDAVDVSGLVTGPGTGPAAGPAADR